MADMSREEAARVLQEFYDFNKTLTPHNDLWLQSDITINRYTQEELGKALPAAITVLRFQSQLDKVGEGKLYTLTRRNGQLIIEQGNTISGWKPKLGADND